MNCFWRMRGSEWSIGKHESPQVKARARAIGVDIAANIGVANSTVDQAVFDRSPKTVVP